MKSTPDGSGRGFACMRCGNCCRVAGYVHVAAAEVDRLAEHLGLDVSAFTRAFTRLTEDRRGLSLTERGDGACVFLDEVGLCRVQAVKPAQCRGFPEAWRFRGYEEVCVAAAAGAARERGQLGGSAAG